MKINQYQQKNLGLVLPLLLLSLITTEVVAQEAIAVIRIKEGLPAEPLAAEWQQAPVQEVTMMAQQVTMPRLAQASVDKITVQALTDGKSISWRLSWLDEAPDFNVDVGRFSDAVALELPLTQGASPMMGHRGGGKVQILYWKGLWQKDINQGFQDVQDVHPNYWSDLYWFAEGKPPYRVPDSFQNAMAKQWFVAQQAGNPMAVFSRKQPAQELIAEGWGTLTHQPESATNAQGIWAEGRWAVVFSRPLATDDPNDYQFIDDKGEIAFAVWQGGDNNVGGRKHWSNWTPYQIQP